jgi:hypothetical protein
MIYNIDKIEQVTSSKGTQYWRADLSSGTELWVGVAIFGGFEDKDLVVGGKIDGELKEKEYMGKPSYTLDAPMKAKTASGGAFKQKMIEETMDRKEKSISNFQASKEESIKLAGAQRDAVLLVTTFYKDVGMHDKEIKDKVIEFRDWLLSDDFTDRVPF